MPDATFQAPYAPSQDPTPEEKLQGYCNFFQKVLSATDQRVAVQIWTNKPTQERNKELSKVLEPYMPKINQLTGQETDVRFLGYALEWVLESFKGKPFVK